MAPLGNVWPFLAVSLASNRRSKTKFTDFYSARTARELDALFRQDADADRMIANRGRRVVAQPVFAMTLFALVYVLTASNKAPAESQVSVQLVSHRPRALRRSVSRRVQTLTRGPASAGRGVAWESMTTLLGRNDNAGMQRCAQFCVAPVEGGVGMVDGLGQCLNGRLQAPCLVPPPTDGGASAVPTSLV